MNGGESLPRAGLVSQIRQNWSVYEDQALATRIQHDEINKHYQGNKSRNQQIRQDVPQAKVIQSYEIQDAEERRNKYREILERQAEADSKLALALALGTRSGFRDSDAPAVGFRDSAAPALGFRAALTPGFRDSDSPEIGFRDLDPVGTGYRDSISAGNRDTWAAEGLDDEYTKKRDEMFARNLQEEGLRKRSRNKPAADIGTLAYNDADYRVTVARPAVVTDEPLYANQEKYTADLSTAEKSARSDTHPRPEISPRSEFGSLADRFSRPSRTGMSLRAEISPRSEMGSRPENTPRAEVQSRAEMSSRAEVQSRAEKSSRSEVQARAETSSRAEVQSRAEMSSRAEVQSRAEMSSRAEVQSRAETSSRAEVQSRAEMSSRAEVQVRSVMYSRAEMSLRAGMSSREQISPRSESDLRAENISRADMSSRAEMQTRSELSARAGMSSRLENFSTKENKTSGEERQHAPVTRTYTEGPGSTSYPSSLAACRIEDLNTSSDCRTSSRTSERSDSSLTSYSELGAYGGACFIDTNPDNILGIGSALSPSELAAAQAAELLFQQERRDAELAQRLQDQLESCEDDIDRKLAIEAQDREFAKILHAKEKARARRAKEKARQRKLEKQRLEEDKVEVLEVEDEFSEAGVSRVENKLSLRDKPSSPREAQSDSRISPRSPEVQPPARKPYVHTAAIDSHVNDTYCKTQITPTVSNSSESSEPQYANLDSKGRPLKTEPILHLSNSKSCDKISPRHSVLNEDMPIPPYMPMQSSASKKSESMERKIKKKKEKEGCKQQ